ncbi:MAG: cyclic nucleotide-binding domain-containing protein [Candidatus Aminicenantia bacterium]
MEPKDFLISYKKGELIFKEGEHAEEMFVIHSGKVRIFKKIDDKEETLAILEKGDFFGEMGILENLPRSASAEAFEDCELIRINASMLDEMMRKNPEISVRILRNLASKLRETDEKLMFMVSQSSTPPIQQETQREELPESIKARLLIEKTRRWVPIRFKEVYLGRKDLTSSFIPDVDLSEEDSERFVSRRHAKIVFRDGKFYITEEIGAMNGTFLNGDKVNPGSYLPLKNGDEITLSLITLIFYADIPK